MFRRLFSICLIAGLISMAFGQFELPGAAAPATQARLVSDVKTVAPGSSFTVALQLEHPQGWHSYYRNSGGVEQAPSIEWTLPEGFAAGEIRWPVPEVKDGFFGKSFVYSGKPAFLVGIQAPAGLQPGKTVTLTAKAAWQICEDSCINEDKSFTLTLATGPAVEKDPANAALFEAAGRKQPMVVGADWKFTASADAGFVILHVQPGDAGVSLPVDFVPDQNHVLSVSSGGSIRKDGSGWEIKLKRADKDALGQDIAAGNTVSGILLGEKPVLVPLTTIGSPAVAGGETNQSPMLSFAALFPVLGGMFLGGLILNLMPCVFPVIGLKIMGFVQQAGSDHRKIALHGITFALGVFASFGVLSLILFFARATTGWGYQLQDPWVILVLMWLMFLMALNMYGVFEMGTSATSVGGTLQSKQGLAGSFFSGVLATVVATPCSGPFLGAAIGAAFQLPAVQFFPAFAAMAFGLSLPYLVLSVFPSLIRHLPRPGVWMESFKQAMSFLLFATTGYLLWVYSGLIDAENLLGPIFGLCAVAVAAWIYGRWNLPHRAARTRMVAVILAVVFAVGGFLISKPPKPSTLVWEPWSEARVTELLAEKKPVYIDFTAKWCATCQVNKKRAYTKDVVDLMHKKGVVTLKGDKTKANPEIEAALAKLGRTAIPVNVLLVPGRDPLIFPELLTPDVLLEALKAL